MKYCGKCGSELDAETGLCPKCDNSAFLNAFRESEKVLVKFEYDRASVFDAINNY